MAEYQSKLTAVTFNKYFMYSAVPLFLIVNAAAQYKYPAKFVNEKQKAAMGLGFICLVTNFRAFEANSKLPDIESRLIDKFVISLPEEQLNRYSNAKQVFPGAR